MHMEPIYVTGDATKPIRGLNDKQIIIHVCNNIGGWGAGFVLALSAKWPEPEARYREWASTADNADSDFKLGRMQLVEVGNDIHVCNIIGQSDIRHIDHQPPVRYWAIRKALRGLVLQHRLMYNTQPFTVHMPRIGCGLAGGYWDEVQDIVQRELCDNEIPVFVYDLPVVNHVA